MTFVFPQINPSVPFRFFNQLLTKDAPITKDRNGALQMWVNRVKWSDVLNVCAPKAAPTGAINLQASIHKINGLRLVPPLGNLLLLRHVCSACVVIILTL